MGDQTTLLFLGDHERIPDQIERNMVTDGFITVLMAEFPSGSKSRPKPGRMIPGLTYVAMNDNSALEYPFSEAASAFLRDVEPPRTVNV